MNNERQNLFSSLQRFIDLLSEGDQLIPEVYLLMGNADAKAFFCFAKEWKEQKREIPIVLAGGRGRGTLPLIESIQSYLKEKMGGILSEEEEMMKRWKEDERILEIHLMEFILRKMGISPSFFFKERAPSTNTRENFSHTHDVIGFLLNRHPLAQPSVAIVTSPPLLLRAQATAKRVWNNSWQVLRWKSYDLDVAAEMDDNQLIALTGYLAGYPEEYVVRYPELNAGNELAGYHANGGEVKEKNLEILDDLKRALKAFLNGKEIRYDQTLRALRIG